MERTVFVHHGGKRLPVSMGCEDSVGSVAAMACLVLGLEPAAPTLRIEGGEALHRDARAWNVISHGEAADLLVEA